MIAILSILAFNKAFGGFVNRYRYDLLYRYLMLNLCPASPFSRSVSQDGHRFVWCSNSRVPTTAATEMPILPSRPYTSRTYAGGYDRRPSWLSPPLCDTSRQVFESPALRLAPLGS